MDTYTTFNSYFMIVKYVTHLKIDTDLDLIVTLIYCNYASYIIICLITLVESLFFDFCASDYSFEKYENGIYLASLFKYFFCITSVILKFFCSRIACKLVAKASLL